jgi:hypothetical protein
MNSTLGGAAPCGGAADAHGGAGKAVNTSSVMQSLADLGRDKRFLGGLHEKLQDYQRAQEKLHATLVVEQQRVQELLRDNTRLQLLLHDKTQIEELVRVNTMLHHRLFAATGQSGAGGEGRAFGADRACGPDPAFGPDHAFGVDHAFGPDRAFGVDHAFGPDRALGVDLAFGPDRAFAADRAPAEDRIRPPPAPARSKRPAAVAAGEEPPRRKQKRQFAHGAEPTRAEVLEMAENVKPLFGLHRWSFVNADVQRQFWEALWSAPAFNKSCAARKADPEGSAWMILRGIGYTNVGSYDTYFNVDHIELIWNVFSCIQNTYKNSKVMLGSKARVPAIIKDFVPAIVKGFVPAVVKGFQPSAPQTPGDGMCLMSQLPDAHRTLLQTYFDSFNVDKFLVSIFPFLPENEAKWQPGRRLQLEDFARRFMDFIAQDKIIFTAPDSEPPQW